MIPHFLHVCGRESESGVSESFRSPAVDAVAGKVERCNNRSFISEFQNEYKAFFLILSAMSELSRESLRQALERQLN
jgi:hypothetical protein